jgi:LacI family transcriptional regulator, galactose operon repressor
MPPRRPRTPTGSGPHQANTGHSLRDVAELAGVSDATASRALRNVRNVEDALRERVREAARKLNYTPNPHARALASSRDTSIGVVVHDISDPYFSEIVRGALEAAAGSGRMLLICNTYRDVAQELAYIRHFKAQRVDALLLAGNADGDIGHQIVAEVNEFEKRGGRVAIVGRYPLTSNAIMPDNVSGARQVADHLVELGHRRIGVIAGPEGLTESRLTGFRERLEQLGVQMPPEQVRVADFTREAGRTTTHVLLDTVKGLTAIFALSDIVAIGVLAALRERGLRVPEGISVAGFDDIPVAQDLQPPLTTVGVPMAEIGRRAVMLLFGGHEGGPTVVRLPTKLVVRNSVGLPPP